MYVNLLLFHCLVVRGKEVILLTEIEVSIVAYWLCTMEV